MAQDSTFTSKIALALVMMVAASQALPAESAQAEVWYSATGDVVKVVATGSTAGDKNTAKGARLVTSRNRPDKGSYETEALFALHGGRKRTTRHKTLSRSGYRSSYLSSANHRSYRSSYKPSYFRGYQPHYSYGSRWNSRQSFYQSSFGSRYSRNAFSGNRIGYQRKGWSVRLNF